MFKRRKAAAATGGRMTPSKRLAICNRCPYRTRDNRCTLCGCFVRAKTKVATEKCPNGYWS